MANLFAPRSPIAVTLQRCIGQNRKDFLSVAAVIDSTNVFRRSNYSWNNLFVQFVKTDPSKLKNRLIKQNRITEFYRLFCNYCVDAINRRLVTFCFAMRERSINCESGICCNTGHVFCKNYDMVYHNSLMQNTLNSFLSDIFYVIS